MARSRRAGLSSALCAIAVAACLIVHAARFQPRVATIELAVRDVDRAADFFTATLGFERDSGATELRLGRERLTLRALPAGVVPIVTARANDPSFQHVAIVVADLDAAVTRLRAADVAFISDGPQTLPGWNRDVAGVRAVYFRDPDGHALELIQFPNFKGEPRWHAGSGALFLGIDHTAIVVRDTAAARAFYRDALGMIESGESFNAGVEQAALSGVPGARVHVTSLRGAVEPGVELLEYLAPRTPPGGSTNDWTIRVDAGDRASPTSDPDGHALASATPSRALDGARGALRAHWTRYLMEAAELAAFMAVTIWGTLLLEHPGSPVRQRVKSGFARRVLMGTIVGATVVLIIRSPFGVASGAHFNPSVTIALLGVGRIAPWDATFYVAAQFIGGVVGVALAAAPFSRASGHEAVGFAATKPGPRGVTVALIAEALISFALLSLLLLAQRDPAWRPHVALVAGALLLIYITFESPLSGMSMNPARSVASALFARRLGATWPYFLAPIPSMALAAWLFGR